MRFAIARTSGAIAALALTMAGQAGAETEVVVRAPAIEETVQTFVEELSAPWAQRQLPRWNHRFCPGVAGMRESDARPLLARIAATAERVGLRVGEPGCRPNVTVFFTADADAAAAELAEHRRLMSIRSVDGNTRGRRALRDFIEASRPVRWWHVSYTTSPEGVAIPLGAAVEVRGSGRIRSNMRQDISRAVIIVDAVKVNGVTVQALGDYLAMAALAQLDPHADLSGLDTILNLFDENATARPEAITGWDMAYLHGLYAARRDAFSVMQQEAEIADRMAEALTASRE